MQQKEREFLHLIEKYKAIVYKIANLYAQNAEDRKDLFQEIMLSLWKAYPTFKGNAKVSTWIYRVSLNTAITNYRKVQKRPVYEPIFNLPEIKVEEVNHAQVEQLNVLYQAIETLNKIDKAIIFLYLEEKSYQEISQIMGITSANAGMRIKRIKKKLAKKLTKIKP